MHLHEDMEHGPLCRPRMDESRRANVPERGGLYVVVWSRHPPQKASHRNVVAFVGQRGFGG